MSDKVNDLKNGASDKADDAHKTGKTAVKDARRDGSNKTDNHRGRSGDARDKGNDALASAKGMFNKLKQRVSGGS